MILDIISGNFFQESVQLAAPKNLDRNLSGLPEKIVETEAPWHIGMSSASHREDPGLNPGKGQFFRIKMKNVIT